MNYKLLIAPDIFEKYPDYQALVIYAQNLENKTSGEQSTRLLRDAETKQRSNFGSQKPSTHPHIAAWRNAYKSFGSKPSKYLCAVEALLGRTLKGRDLPTINEIVDLYNAISVSHVLPVGGEDWDALESDLTLRFATGAEPFVTCSCGETVVDYPKPGEVVWADSAGVTCRRWNWRQCDRTALTVNTRSAYFVLDRLAPYPEDCLDEAGEQLRSLLKTFSPNCAIKTVLLSAQTRC